MAEKTERKNTVTYYLNGITYLPHYVDRDVYVGPGYGTMQDDGTINSDTYTANELKQAGARHKIEHLMTRTWC